MTYPIRRHDDTLTGRIHARPGWFGRLIPQVEICRLTYSALPPMPGCDPAVWQERMREQGSRSWFWRDATWSDMQTVARTWTANVGVALPAPAWVSILAAIEAERQFAPHFRWEGDGQFGGYIESRSDDPGARPYFDANGVKSILKRIAADGVTVKNVGADFEVHPMIHLTREQHDELLAARAERDRLHALVNSPEVVGFLRGVHLEAVHQVERWGNAHDRAKRPADWFWLVGYLARKALHAAVASDLDKARHHCISTAAALYNWHCAITGQDVRMCPGSSDVAQIVDAAFPGEATSPGVGGKQP